MGGVFANCSPDIGAGEASMGGGDDGVGSPPRALRLIGGLKSC
jgi:hypothetical protein